VREPPRNHGQIYTSLADVGDPVIFRKSQKEKNSTKHKREEYIAIFEMNSKTRFY
jgi:hypothetical protein